MENAEARVIIANCFKAWESRVELLYYYFSQKGYKVEIIHSNFDHMKKVHFNYEDSNYTMLDTLSYKKNMSIRRIVSHWMFARKFYSTCRNRECEILYVLAPPNSLIKFAAKLKSEIKSKLIIDLIDMWPESMPMKRFKNNPFINVWRNLRDRHINTSDLILTECNYYKEMLENRIDHSKQQTLYFAYGEELNIIPTFKNLNSLEFVYLGSINNIIDIDLIVRLLREVSKHKTATLNIIGDGEKRDLLLNSLDEAGVKYNFHGKVYDQKTKSEVFSKCHFALNIMKNDVKVGLTMKSIDYFQNSLPIINTIPGDTSNFVVRNNIGINISRVSLKTDIEKIVNITLEELNDMKLQTNNLYVRNFSRKAFLSHLDNILENSNLI